MRRKSKMYIFSNLPGQVNRLPPVEFLLEGELVNGQPRFKLVQTGHTLQTDAQIEAAGDKEAPTRQSDIESIAKRRARLRTGFFEPQTPGVFFALKMKSAALRNLPQMNLHG